jgi:dTDP-4-dehydrorhamnose reductase
MRVLITGASGQVGRALLALAPSAATVAALTHRDLDLTDAQAVQATVARFRPDLIINAAAYTAVDLAESQPELAHAVNALGPKYLAASALALGACRLLQVSTDYVFDGSARLPYTPTDTPRPLNVYGRSKLQGEQAVLETLPLDAVVVRTSWVYAPQGKNFMLTMLRLMRSSGAVRVVADQFGSPTLADSVAAVLWRAGELPGAHGIFHWTDAGVISWYEFACAIAQEAVALGLLKQSPQVTAIRSAEFPAAASRPERSALDCADTQRRLGLPQIPWRSNLRTALSRLRELERGSLP